MSNRIKTWINTFVERLGLLLSDVTTVGEILSWPSDPYRTFHSETGPGDGGMSSTTPGLRPIGKRSSRMLAVEEFEQRRLTSDDVVHGFNIYSFYDGLEPIHIMTIDYIGPLNGPKQVHGSSPTGPRSSSCTDIYPDDRWGRDGTDSSETKESD